MKALKVVAVIFLGLALAGFGGLVYVAMTDVVVPTKQVVKEIPHERFSDSL